MCPEDIGRESASVAIAPDEVVCRCLRKKELRGASSQ